MKKYLQFSTVLFVVATIAFGVIEIITGDFNKGLLPVPAFVPGRTILAYSSGIIFVLLGSSLLVKRWRATASFSIIIVYLIYFVFLHLVKLSADIYDGGEWTATFELLLLCSGAIFLTVINTPADSRSKRLLTIGRYAFAISLVVFAVLHFKYAEYISTLIPAWVPAKLFLAYFIGVGFLLTAISIIINVLAGLSTGLIGCMFLVWVIILHAPRALVSPHSEPEWTSLFVALASGGTSLMCSYLSKK